MSITAKVKYLKSVLRFLAVITASTASVLSYNMEDGSPISFQRSIKYSPLLPQLIDPFPPQENTLCLKSSHTFWNGRSIGRVVPLVNATKKLRKIKQDDKAGLVKGTLIMYHRFEQNDLQIPAIMTLEWYRSRAIQENAYEEFKKSFIKNIKKKNNNTGGMGKDWTLYKGEMGDIPLELSINGNITFNGNLRFENKDLVTTNQKDSKNWDLEIEQTQRFNIMGNIGDRFFIDIAQDSEADFSWENDIKIEYRGQKNEILQKAEAGNINLNLVGMDAVNMGGNNSSLFGIKAVYQLGPVEMQSVIAMEQVKKSEKTMTGGMVSSGANTIKDYNFLVDRYFFIDTTFMNQYYPLTENHEHQYNPDYVVGNYEVYQKVTNTEGDPISAIAYIDPLINETDSVIGHWKRLEENKDYEIDRLLGYLRVNSAASQNALAIAYTITSYESQTFGIQNSSTGTNFKQEYIDCTLAIEDADTDCAYMIKLKLLKGDYTSTPTSPTWHLMFKNVYSLGNSNIDPSSLEIDIVRNLGADLQETHSDSGNSYLSIFDLDSEDQNNQKIPNGCDNINLPCTGDGIIDLYGSIINFKNGELLLPAYLPFAYESTDIALEGNNHNDLYGILPELDKENDNPAMYYDNNENNKINQHEFLIIVKTSTQSSSMELGAMLMVEGSETVRLGNQVLQKDVDYTIDYFSGVINFINEDALDPGADISVSYEENQFISFDQKLLMGTYGKYAFGENNYLAGGMFYYNQSIAEEKVDIGYEPMRNFAWNVTGKYQDELGFLTKAVDFLPLIQTTKPSQFSIEGNYAEIIPNPNPLGEAFIDDFEASKRTSSLSIIQRQWKMASPPEPIPQDSSQTLETRGRMFWYNPYDDEPTKNIWPEQSTSTQANNNTTKILNIETKFQGEVTDTLWNGIMIPLYISERNQSLSKYMDIWMNADIVQDTSLRLYVDIGHISEDWNDNGKLDSEDENIYHNMGNGVLSDGEDIGMDQCTNSYENGWGGCLCDQYDPSIYNYSDLNAIYSNEEALCLAPENPVTYSEAVINGSASVNLNADQDDPNGDDWCYNGISLTTTCSGTNDYSRINGTEGNGQAMGYRYPDTEDMDKNNTLDVRNHYFSILINPLQEKDDENSLVVTETQASGNRTGWKLFRIPLFSFDTTGTPEWSDVRSFRLRVRSDYMGSDAQIIKIAKIELVRNEWEELGIANIDYVANEDSIHTKPYFSVEVINTDESTKYKEELNQVNIVREHDEYNDIDMKEQSLVISFVEDKDELDSSGLDRYDAGLIKNTFQGLSSEQALSYLVYEKMEMYVYGGDPESDDCNWCKTDSSEVDLLFRFGKDMDDNYYEIRQPIYKGWDEKNHLNINIDKLTQLKIPIINSEIEQLLDVGLDGCSDSKETGYIDGEHASCLETLTFTYYCNDDTTTNEYKSSFIDTVRCTELKLETTIGSAWDPNNDNWSLENDDLCSQYTSESECDLNGNQCDWGGNSCIDDGTEGNDTFDSEDTDNDGSITAGEAEKAVEDYDGDGKYTQHPNQSDSDRELYVWENNIKNVCHQCTALYMKGEPSIKNIKNIVMGVINNSSDRIYGKVLVNELRMTGVKKSKETSYSISGSLNFADLITISGNYKHKDFGFHKLQQRLGTGNSDDTYSATIKLHPNIILPTRWGIKTPVTLNYSNSINTPKYYPGSDMLTENQVDIENIQTKTEKISISTSFRKSSRSTNWLLKRTIDNIVLSYSAIQNNKSSIQIQEETKQDYEVSGSYTYNWGKENYFIPFKFTKDWLIIGGILSQSRYYYTPDKFSTSIQFNESDKRTIQRVNIDETTRYYSFIMRREFKVNHKFTKTLSSNYTLKIDSNLDKFEKDKWKIIKNLDPGLIKVISEKFTNTYKPDYLKWLNPNITFNPTYKWELSNIEFQTADVQSSTIFKTQIGLNIQEFIELIYTPENKRQSSRGRGRSRSSSSTNKNDKKINIQNPMARLILGKMHSMVSKLRNISSTYTYSTSHDYNNIRADISPSYLYRFGLQEFPLDRSGTLYDPSNTSNNLLGSSGHSYSTDFRTSTNINIIQSVNTSLEYKYAQSLSASSTSYTTENKSFSYYALGNRGDKGFPIANWSINWTKIEKMWILDKLFKSVSLNHGFNGEQSMSYNNSELKNEQYNFSYSPIIGITSTTKGHNPITMTANYNLNQTIKNIDESTERNHNNQLNMTVKLRKSGGLKLKTFFFRDFYIKNNMDFSLAFNYNTERVLKTAIRVLDIAEFDEHANNISWSLKPNMSYSFTDYITGNFYMLYGISENQTTGRKEEKDFGFSMNIKIHG